MESSEEEEDFPSIESITPQSKIDAIYQSNTEKGIRKICFELLDLKDAVENLCGNTRAKYSAFLRLSEEVVETEHELNELRKRISAQGVNVHDLMSGLCHELEQWSKANADINETQQNHKKYDLEFPVINKAEDRMMVFLENIDVLLAEHKVEEAIEAMDAEENSYPELKTLGVASSTAPSSYKNSFLKRKERFENLLVEIIERPSVGIAELKKALSNLLKLGKGSLAHQLLLKSYGARLHKSMESFLPRCPCYPETYSATLSNLVFSTISLTTKENALMFGDNPIYSNKVVQWAEWEIESFVRLVKENAPSSDTVLSLRALSICVQASLNHCSVLESQGLKLSKVLLGRLQPYVDEVLDVNFRRARRVVLNSGGNEEGLSLSPRFASPLSTFATSSDSAPVDSGMRFIFLVKDIVEQMTHLMILHFGGNVLTRISQLFDKYVDSLIKAIPGPSEDDSLTELKEPIPFRAETDSQQLELLGTAYTVAEELLPMVVSRIWSVLNESKELADSAAVGPTSNSIEFKDWGRHTQHSLEKLKNHFCLQYVLNFIYSGDGDTQLNVHIYISGEGEDLLFESDPLPSLPFQALFGKLQQLATVAGDVLLGKDKIQKILLAKLTETVVMWLSAEHDFWSVLEDDSAPLRPLGLQQLILDMRFTVEIARFAGYSSRQVHQLASAVITRAIRIFSARGIDPQSTLPEDEWFVDTAKAAIHKLLLGASGSDMSEIDEEHIIMDDDIITDSDDSPSSLSSVYSFESFASAVGGELESPDFTDPDT